MTEDDKEEVPQPVTNFADLKMPLCIEKHLAQRGITRPTPIQMQGLPFFFGWLEVLAANASLCSFSRQPLARILGLTVALSGRDMIGIAFTGSGKTLCFSMPLIMLALEQEVALPFENGEGPFGVILCPSRELARQTYDTIREYIDVLAKDGYPRLGLILCIGGVDMREQFAECPRGLHIAVCTPGRLIDMLTKKKFTLDVCRYLCMDEADRMIDLGFEEDVSVGVGFSALHMDVGLAEGMMFFIPVFLWLFLVLVDSNHLFFLQKPATDAALLSHHAYQD